jgi:hypothetical protein
VNKVTNIQLSQKWGIFSLTAQLLDERAKELKNKLEPKKEVAKWRK